MNRPSRSDDDPSLEHPGWNQSPPFLAPDLTTRQDLNGIANSRVYRNGSGGGGGGGGPSSVVFDEKQRGLTPETQSSVPGALIAPSTARPWSISYGLASHPLETGAGGEGRACLAMAPIVADSSSPEMKSLSTRIKGWVTWVLSVVVCAVALSWLMGTLSLPAQWRKEGVELLHAGSVDATQETHVQFSYDQQRLGKRLSKRSTCPVNTPIPEAIYNTPLHAGALVIILAVSSSACAFPMLAKRVPGIRLPAVFFFSVRHFGTGVLIATAFVHLLPTAFILLGDKCLDSFWTTDYPAMPGAIALGGIFLVTIIEMVFHPARHVPSEAVGRVREGGGSSAGERRGSVASAQEVRMNGDVEPEMTMTMTQIRSTTGNNNSDSTVVADDDINNGGIAVRPMGQVLGRSTSMGRRLSHLRCQDPDGLNQVQQQHTQTLNKHLSSSQASLGAIPSRDDSAVEQEENAGTWVPNALTAEQKHRKELLQCVLLEVGILFHSVFIGMALSVSIRGEFIVLLIAIAFHQTFEGLALGSRIASIEWPKGSWQPWLMALAYGCTTPIGQALGLATHSLYSPDSETGLILVGTMNAISSGLLTFASLVELLSEDFLSDESWRILRGRKRIYACLLVFAGAVFMSLVGAWA